MRFFFGKFESPCFLLNYALYGIVNTIFSFSIYSALIFIDFSYQFATLIALIIGVFFSYFTQSNFVFKSKGSRLFFKYILIWFFLYFINIFLIYVFINSGINKYYSGALSSVVMVVLSFLLQRNWIFKKR